ncbi:hypothetical protein QFZ82_003118 [Streptomyces sp. V4I23]|uniref:hypothetical protein n=1 Tax=Streptomyces sp. V4I23 TaxID=3042282 RepID=UPI00277E5DAC|nr:hypothetical protein [Streptomyces sp. V4I23]MDQ1008633.1 hypothetical protein [Streptomyces sp. V4I23]
MSIRRILKARRGAAAVVITATLALTVAGCGGDSDKKPEKEKTASAKPGSENNDSGEVVPDTGTTLATVKGPKDIDLVINSVKRESGGFVTVNGQMKNNGAEAFYDMSPWRGTEQEVLAGGISVAGATLVDKAGKKRYYILRDTDGRCLCTSGLDKIDPGKSIPVFFQFPAPPESTTEIDFQLPTFPTVSVEISG